MLRIEFNSNWNNKLDCTAFSTIRLRNDEKYIVNNNYLIDLKLSQKKSIEFMAQLVYMRHMKLDEITEAMARLDTGYSRMACIKIIETMYKNKNINLLEQQFSFMVLTKKV